MTTTNPNRRHSPSVTPVSTAIRGLYSRNTGAISIALIFLAALVSESTAQIASACTPAKQFCNAAGAFDSIHKYQYFDNSIGLFQSAYMVLTDETRTAYQNPNIRCASQGYTPV